MSTPLPGDLQQEVKGRGPWGRRVGPLSKRTGPWTSSGIWGAILWAGLQGPPLSPRGGDMQCRSPALGLWLGLHSHRSWVRRRGRRPSCRRGQGCPGRLLNPLQGRDQQGQAQGQSTCGGATGGAPTSAPAPVLTLWPTACWGGRARPSPSPSLPEHGQGGAPGLRSRSARGSCSCGASASPGWTRDAGPGRGLRALPE